MVKPVSWCLALILSAGTALATEPVTDYQWSIGPFLPEPLQEIYPAVLDKHIYVAGGLNQSNNGFTVSDGVYRLEPSGQKWQSLAPLPEPRHHAVMAAGDKDLWLFGGFIESQEGPWTSTNSILRYNPRQNTWHHQGQLPQPVSEPVVVYLDGHIHLIGGRIQSSEANGQWRDHTDTDWHGIYEPDSGIWKTATELPTPRNSACAVVYDHKIHVIGGRQVGKGNVAAHEVFDPKSSEWQSLKPMPQAQAGIACVSYRHNIFVFGGEYFDNGGGVYNEVWRYDLQRDRWSQASIMPLARHGLGAVMLSDQIWLIGGAAKAGAVETSAVVSKLKKLN